MTINKTNSFLLFILATMLSTAGFGQSVADTTNFSTPVKHRPGFYYGLGLGTGQGWVEDRSFNYLFDKQESAWDVTLERSFRITLNVGFGLVLNQKWQIGLDLSASRQYMDKKAWGKDQDMSFRINNYLLAARYFPTRSGFSIKAGIGLPGYQGRILREIIHETYSGYAGLLGIGYDLRMNKTLKIGFHVDYSHQRFPSQDGPDYTNMLNTHVSFYCWNSKRFL